MAKAKDATQAAGPEAPAEPKKVKYLTITISSTRRDDYNRLNALATKLGCGASGLVWSAVLGMLKDPPAKAPPGSTARVSTAIGFWVVHQLEKGRLVNASVVECLRNQVDGRVFFRYKAGDAAGRKRALKQGIQAAAYDLSIVGKKAAIDDIKVKSVLPAE